MHKNKFISKKNESRFYTIDIIRGLAALSVLFSHWGGWVEQFADQFTKNIIQILQAPTNFIWQAGGTHPGVIVFIVLSGFCIHLSVEKNKNTSDRVCFWKIYFLRRSIRIYPVYWLALTVGLVVALLINSSLEINLNLIVSFLTSAIGIAELIRQAGLLNYLYLGNPPLGTVGVEILLYASYPIWRHIYNRSGLKFIFLFVSICYVIFITMRLKGMPLDLSLGSYFEFVPYWIWGAISAEIYYVYLANKNIKRKLIVIVLMLSIIYVCLISQMQLRGLYLIASPLLAVISGLFIVIILDTEVRSKRNYSKLSLLSEIGERGYSLYAIHTPIIFFGIWLLNEQEVRFWYYPALTLGFVVIATEFCYRVIEKPTHRLARNISNDRQVLT